MRTFTVRAATNSDRRNYYKIAFLLIWCVGMLTGISIALHKSSTSFSMMRSFLGRVSIVGLLVSSSFPFVISAIMISLGQHWLLLPLGFIKAFTYFFCVCSVALVYGLSAWLTRYLLMFSASVASILLLWFCLRCITEQRCIVKRTIICILITGIICVVDYRFVIPMAEKIFHYS